MSALAETAGPPFTETGSERWIFDRLEEWRRTEPNRTAFIVDHSDRTEEYSVADVLQYTHRVAAGLEKIGIREGDRVGILMENIPQWVFVLLGILRIRAIAVPLATALPESALRRIIEHSGCRMIFADAPNIAKAFDATASGKGMPVVVYGGHDNRAMDWNGFLQESAPVRGRSGGPDDTAILIYTSGTTGDPKAVELTTHNLACEIWGVIEPFELSPGHRILSVLPFSHVLPLIANALGPLWVGAAVVFLSSISPQRIIEAFHKHRISLFICVPQFFYVLHKRIFSEVDKQPFLARWVFRRMFRFAERISNTKYRRLMFGRIHKAIGPDLSILASGGSRFDPQIAHDLHVLGYTVLQAYGLTETAAAVTVTPVRDKALGTVGKPIRGVSLRIDSPDDQGVGEIWIRGPIVMKGYYRDEAGTRSVMSDGWFKSGDLGFIRADGNLVITGRRKDVIVLPNGKNIYPEELEAHYGQIPFVKELCILGIPSGPGEPEGEKLHAVVVPDMEEFKRRGQTSVGEMIRFELENLSKQLPSYQRILSVSFRQDPLPRTVTRKLKRFEIQKEEIDRSRTPDRGQTVADHPVFESGAGAVVAELVREAKPGVGPLDVTTNLEMDLGFDSLTRVELLGLAEARLGTHVDEKESSRIFTLGELVEALTASQNVESARGRNWKEILNAAPDDELKNHAVFNQSKITRFSAYLMIKAVKLASVLFLRLRAEGLENLPRDYPFLICPNHESFLDGPLLISILPRRVIDRIFILGYTDYWQGWFKSRLGIFCNIVPIDPNVNLVRAMQIGAFGMKEGRVLLIFPEGTRTIDGHLGEFKKGSAILAYELGVPIVPVGMLGGYEMWPRGGSFRLHPVKFVFGEPIYPQTFAGASDPYAALTAALKERVKLLANDV